MALPGAREEFVIGTFGGIGGGIIAGKLAGSGDGFLFAIGVVSTEGGGPLC